MAIIVVNMIPNAQSGETNQDSEPNLAVNLQNPLEIVGSAFTPDPMGGANAPIYISTDGGNTWLLNSIVPSQAGSLTGTGDITVRYSGSGGRLYAGILRVPGGLRLNILRTANPLGPAAMEVLVDRTGSGVDQPYVQAATVLGGQGVGNDRVYVGDNDFNGPGGRTATIDFSLDAATAPPPAGFTLTRIETRATSSQDGPPIRPAIHHDGTVYAVFYGWRAFTGTNATTDVVVVRDDNWAIGANPFQALTDPGDGLAGRLVVTNRTVPWANFSQANFGQERFVGSNLSIAIDPNDSSRVYIAWADRVGTNDYTLHVRRSTDRGETWSADLRIVTNATNPALAVTSRGMVGFLYQQLTGTGTAQRWVTRLERTNDDWATAAENIVLANVPANAPAPLFIPYIGDYLHLMAVGKDLCGIFSANNTPNMANFPNGVIYQRNANFGAQTLLAANGTTPVAVSIDPFFFRVTGIPGDAPEASDFYVRDWTDSPIVRDLGQEPSTNPVFYATSDVWNRRSDAPGGFSGNDRPFNQNPQMVTLGDNFGFARIHRNASGTSESVSAHFLVSEFGVGSNYQNAAAAPDPIIAFGDGDLVQTMANGYAWQLPVTTSTHVCFAVEIATPTDPVAQPTLLGRAPGWPTTDLLVINDNNKAQRNMGVYPTSGSGSVAFYGLVHNAATRFRDLIIRFQAPEPVLRRLRGARIAIVGGDTTHVDAEGRLVLSCMAPGENRWLGLEFDVPAGHNGEPLAVLFQELVGTTVVNGFGLGPMPSAAKDAAHDNLLLHVATFARLAAVFGVDGAQGLADSAAKLLSANVVDVKAYVAFLDEQHDAVTKVVDALVKLGQGDPFGLLAACARLQQATGDAVHAVPAHATLVHGLDAFLSMLQKRVGDIADINQNVRWQAELFEEAADSLGPGVAAEVVERSNRFIAAFDARRLGTADFPQLIGDLLTAFRHTEVPAAAIGVRVDHLIAEMKRQKDPATLQKLHRDYLLALEAFRKPPEDVHC